MVNKLLASNFLTAKKESDRRDYFLTLAHLPVYQNYFSLMSYELQFHENEQVLHLVSLENYNQLHLKKNESIVLLTLRKLYFLKQKEISEFDEIIISIEELHEELLPQGFF